MIPVQIRSFFDRPPRPFHLRPIPALPHNSSSQPRANPSVGRLSPSFYFSCLHLYPVEVVVVAFDRGELHPEPALELHPVPRVWGSSPCVRTTRLTTRKSSPCHPSALRICEETLTRNNGQLYLPVAPS